MEVKLQEIRHSSDEIFALTARLRNSTGSASTHDNLIASIRESIQVLEKDLEYANTFVEDEDDMETRQEQKLMVLIYMDDLSTHRRLYRKAVLEARKNLETTKKAEHLLLISATESKASEEIATINQHNKAARRSRRDEDTSSSVLSASSDVTSELRKTHALMSEELSKSALSQELLAQSSSTLTALGEEYTAFGAILNGSKRLLKELENADRTDQLWIWGSFGFFCVVVAWILYRRILSRPVNALIWTGSFMFSRLNQRKILDNKLRSSSSVVMAASVSTAPQSSPTNAPYVEKSEVDDMIDLVVPDLETSDDHVTRMNLARAREKHEDRRDFIHAEL